MRLAWMVVFFGIGCAEPAPDCPSDRPLDEADLPCQCGERKADAVYDCGETWCFPESSEVTCPNTTSS